jgi:signal recognition particle subunit SEC65
LSVNQFQVIVPDTYLQNPPSDPANPDRAVTVTLSVIIMSIDKINTALMMFALTMMVSYEWKDPRLKFNNLKQGEQVLYAVKYNQNKMITIENTVIIHVADPN